MVGMSVFHQMEDEISLKGSSCSVRGTHQWEGLDRLGQAYVGLAY